MVGQMFVMAKMKGIILIKDHEDTCFKNGYN